MNISLTPQLEMFIKQKLETGRYSSGSEVVREALRLLEERDALQSVTLDALRKDINQGLKSLEDGKGRPLDVQAIMTRGRQALAGKGQ